MTKFLRQAQILAFAGAEGFENPYLKTVKFVFADDKPNLNNQAIPYEEFANLKASAMNMPIKIRFLGKRGGAGNHDGSIPIGHISAIAEELDEDGTTHKLVADGVLYADEYPDIVEYLEEAYAQDQAPGISWELSYRESIVEQGIMLLKGVIARAATFVKHPAYGKRTALLALASDATLSDEEIEQEIVSLFAKEPEIKGGTNNVTLEEALAKIAELEAALASKETELEAKASEIQTLNEAVAKVTELEANVTELEGAIAAYEKATIVADRTQKMVAAGVVLDTDAEKLAQKQELWAAMSEEIFNEVISTVAAVATKAPAKAEASARVLNLPKFTVDTSGGSTSVPDLMSRMRAISRNADESAE